MSTQYPPRYVPTLTEVVNYPQPPEVLPVPAVLGLEADTARISRDVLQAVAPLVEQHMRQAARAMFEQQLDAQMPELKRHLETAVRQAVDQALGQRQYKDSP